VQPVKTGAWSVGLPMLSAKLVADYDDADAPIRKKCGSCIHPSSRCFALSPFLLKYVQGALHGCSVGIMRALSPEKSCCDDDERDTEQQDCQMAEKYRCVLFSYVKDTQNYTLSTHSSGIHFWQKGT
jgi:hypothetical protein